MNLSCLFNSQIYALVILPIFIFIARVCDVSLGTIRIIFISKGHKLLAPIVSFIEILIWLLAIGQIFKNLNSAVLYVAYAGGFAIGTYVGIYLEEKLAMGILLIRVITKKKATALISFLRQEGYRVTNVEAEHNTGLVDIVYVVINRRDVDYIIKIVDKFNPNAFYTIEDIKSVNKEIFSKTKPLYENKINLLKLRKKAK